MAKKSNKQPVKYVDVKLLVKVIHERDDRGNYEARWEVVGWPGASERSLREAIRMDGTDCIDTIEGAEAIHFITAKVPVPPVSPTKTVKAKAKVSKGSRR